MADMTAVEPTGLNAAGKVGVFWVPAIADPNAPKLTEIQAGLNLSLILYTWELNGTQEKTERYRYGSKAGGTSLGITKYETGALEYDWDPQTPNASTGEYKHVATLAAGLAGFFVDRRGIVPGVAPATTQVVTVIPVMLGEQIPMNVDPRNAGEKHRIRQEFAITGELRKNVTIAT